MVDATAYPLREELLFFPADWRLVRVGPDKRPIGAKWQSEPGLSPDDAIELEQLPPAFGLLSGPQSGCIVLDLDGEGWREDFLERTGHPIEDLPQTIAWTSGKPGRSGRAFAVEDEWWPHLANRRPFVSAAGETLWELRGDRHQAVLIGVHPETGRYRWLDGCSPADIPDPAPAPEWLLELMVVQEIAEAPEAVPREGDADRAVAMLDHIPAAQYCGYDDWLRIGMALHSTDPGLLAAWVKWSSDMAGFNEGECLEKWQSFGKSNRGRPATIASLHFIAKQHGYVEPKRKRERKTKEKAKAVRALDAVPFVGGGNGANGNGNGSNGSNGNGNGNGASKPAPAKDRPFVLLGFNGDDYYYQPKGSGQVTRLTRSGHNPTNLFGIAPIEHWEATYGRYNKDGELIGVSWMQCYSDLMTEQHEVGCYDPSRIRGVGAWWDEGRTVFHLGDRLIVDGVKYSVKEPHASEYIYQRLPKRDGPGAAEPLTDQEGANLAAIAERFHWETETSGVLLAGWTALAPICGALEWRPHVWLNAVAGSGKSSLMDLYVGPLLSDMGFFVLGNTTEAGIRQKLKSDALPIVFDEAESNEKRDTDRMQGVLALARAASSEGRGVTVKGSVASEAMLFNVRSMFMLSSINMALKQGADRSRFSVLMLRIPDKMTSEEKAEHWKSLKADLVGAITPDTGRRLVARMVNLIPQVRESAKVFAAVVAVELDGARVGDQVGTLLAGAWALQRSSVPSEDEARTFLRIYKWGQHGEGGDERGGDQGGCLAAILQSRIRLDREKGSASFTVAELIEKASGSVSDALKGEATAELGRHGILVDCENDSIVVSNTAEGIKRLLRDTQWAGGGWANLLRSLHGAERTEKPVWFPELKTMNRGTRVPKTLMQEAKSPD